MTALNPQLHIFLLSLVAYNSFFTGLVIFIKRRDRLAFQFLISNFLTGGWAFGLSHLVLPSASVESAEFWGRFSQICFLLTPLLWLHFVIAYSKTQKLFRTALWAGYAGCLGMIFAFPRESFLASFSFAAGMAYAPVAGPAYKGLTVLFVTLLVYAFWILWDYSRSEKSLLKQDDARFFFFTQLYGYGLMSISLLPLYGWDFPAYQFLILPFWQFTLAYAMIRHDLLDSESLARALHRDRLAALATVTASMQHELKNPLTAIKTFAEYLPKKYDDPEFRSKFSTIVTQEVARVNDLLRQLLDFSKAGDSAKAPVDLPGLMEETIHFLSHSCEIQNIEIRKNLLPGVQVTADRNQLRQVFLNLMLNGIQAMPEGGVLGVCTEKNAKGQIVISISDTGTGIPAENLKQIRDPFFTTKDKGTGLGLSIVQSIADKHDAVLEIESHEGKGTTVRIVMKQAS